MAVVSGTLVNRAGADLREIRDNKSWRRRRGMVRNSLVARNQVREEMGSCGVVSARPV